MPLPRDVVTLSDEQFGKLVELLTPGYELAKAYMAQMAPQPNTPLVVDEPDPELPKVDDPSKGEGNPMGDGNTAPELFRKAGPAPSFDDPSKQGSG